MKNKSIKKNILINAIKVLVLAIFPLITFPYATRVLGANNLGKVQFATSIISFFLLFSSLGINSYAIREASPIRDDRKKISQFTSEVFSINIITTIISYLLLFILLIISPKINLYSNLILILSIQIIFTTIGLDWIYTVFEEYFYIMIRSVIIQIVSLILMVLFVKEPSDYYKYAIITVLANSSIYLINYFHLKKYVDFKFTFKNNYKKHLKPLIVLFSNEITQQIYINSDMLMLGLISSDYYTGLYSVSVKIYSLVKKLLNSFIAVLIPRLAYYNKNDEQQFYRLCSNIFNISILLLMPIMLLLFLFSDNLVVFIAGNEYINGGVSLKILSVALLASVFANLFCNGVLIVKKLEKYVLRGSIIAAFSNIVLNLFFIKLLKQNGAAITTVISEVIITIYAFIKSKKYIRVENFLKNFIFEIIGCVGILMVYYLTSLLRISNDIMFMIFSGFLCIIVYFLIEYLLKNYFLISFIKNIPIFNYFKKKVK